MLHQSFYFSIDHIPTRTMQKFFLKDYWEVLSGKEIMKNSNWIKNWRNNLKSEIRNTINGMKWYLLIQAIEKNIKHSNIQIAKKHEIKLSNLMHNKDLPSTPDDVITNLFTYNISHEEVNILKYGLRNSIPPEILNWTDVFVNFDWIHRYLTEELKSKVDGSSLRANLSYLANSYYSNYKTTRAVLRKQGILRKFRNSKDIVILRSDKGNGVVKIYKIT